MSKKMKPEDKKLLQEFCTKLPVFHEFLVNNMGDPELRYESRIVKGSKILENPQAYGNPKNRDITPDSYWAISGYPVLSDPFKFLEKYFKKHGPKGIEQGCKVYLERFKISQGLVEANIQEKINLKNKHKVEEKDDGSL